MMERIASRSWVLDGGQKDGGEAWSETQEINRSTWFITTGFKYVFVDTAADYNPFSINDKENLTVSFKRNWNLMNLLPHTAGWRCYSLSPAGGVVCWCLCYSLQAKAVARSCWVDPSPSRTGRFYEGPSQDWSSCRSQLLVPSPAVKSNSLNCLAAFLKVQNSKVPLIV